MKRFALFCFVVVVLLQVNRFGLKGQNDFTVKSFRDKAISAAYIFHNFSNTKMVACLQHCLAHCLCMSFQICNDKKCQLCSPDKYLKSDALQMKSGCTYYNISTEGGEDTESTSNQQCVSTSCKRVVNCCLTSQPCLNRGACVPDKKKRFRCICPDGYQGERCETKCEDGYGGYNCETFITSCRGYAGGNRVSGIYKIFEQVTKTLYDVFCYFDTNSKMAWTLFQSYEYENLEPFANSFLLDTPVSEYSPSLQSYRLSKRQMKSIGDDSSQWRITCGFTFVQTELSNDYIQVVMNKLNILTYQSEGCIEVEFVRVGERNCSGCTVYLKQTNIDPIHSIYKQPVNQNTCTFHPLNHAHCNGRSRSPKFDHYFGFASCKNRHHQCANSKESTTQTWFGGE